MLMMDIQTAGHCPGMRNAAAVMIAMLVLGGCSSDAHVGADSDASTGPDGHLGDGGPVPDAASAACDQDIVCPDPGGGMFMACGRIFDVETSQSIVDFADPSSIHVGFYDASSFFSHPTLPPLLSVSPDACGRFASFDATHPGIPAAALLAVVADGDGGKNHPDPFVKTGIVVPGASMGGGSSANKLAGVRAWATRSSTASQWGDVTPGTSFVTPGAYLGIFIDTTKPAVAPFPGTPAPGVTLTRDGAVSANQDFYFEDTDARVRRTVDVTGAQSATNANGSVLFVNSALVPFGGQPAPLGGCDWPSYSAATAPGTVFVQEHLLVCE
jgi:hypothetical protein